MRTYSSHRLPPAGQHDEGSVGNRAQGAQRDRLVEDGRAAELHDVRRFAGRRLQRRAQRLVFQLGDGGVRLHLQPELPQGDASTTLAQLKHEALRAALKTTAGEAAY